MNRQRNNERSFDKSTTYSAMLFLTLASFILTAAECDDSTISSSTTLGGPTSSSSTSLTGPGRQTANTGGNTDPVLDEQAPAEYASLDSTATPESNASTPTNPEPATSTTEPTTASPAADDQGEEDGICSTDAQCGPNKDCVQGICVNTGPLRFTLLWNQATDIDMHVLTPSGAKLWYRNRNTSDGGRFDSDSCIGTTCQADGPLLENVFWVNEPNQGTYQFWAVNYTGAESVSFTFDVFNDGERQTHRGTVGTGRNTESQRFTVQLGDEATPPAENFVTVEDAMRNTCSTASVRGLSQQLIDELNCLEPGSMKSFAGARNINIQSVVFPYLQTAATDAMIRSAASGGAMSVSSALRTIPQQYLLYRWGGARRCSISIAAPPGRSNHNSGTAFDTPDRTTYRQRLTNNNYRWFGPNDAVHYDYQGNTRDVRTSSVRAFQRLWNRNNPNDRITEDGSYGPTTENRLKRSPAAGFRQGASCSSPNALTEWFHPTVAWQVNASGLVDISTIAPADVAFMEYLVDSEIVHTASREDGANFDATLALTKSPIVTIMARGYDREGRLVSSQTGWLIDRGDIILSVRPNGPEIYEFSLDYGPKELQDIAVIFNDAPVMDDRRKVERADDIAVFSHLPIDLNAKAHERALSIGLFNGDDKLVEILNFELP